MDSIITDSDESCHVNPLACLLCDQSIHSKSIESEKGVFCCHGCLAVFEILENQNALSGKLQNPLFLKALSSGVISNPELIAKEQVEGAKRWALEIKGMWCNGCAHLISLILSQCKGVLGSRVDYMTDFAAIDYDPMATSKEELKTALKKWGYQLSELDDPSRKSWERSHLLRMALAFFCALNVMMFAYPLYGTFFDADTEELAPILSYISFALTLPVVTYCAWPIYRRFYVGLKHGYLGMETLVVASVVSSMILSLYEMVNGTHAVYFDTVGMLIALLLLGKSIEQSTKFSAKEALLSLQFELPRKGRRVLGESKYEIIPLKEFAPGDLLQVFMGEKIPLDGIVIKGEGACDESTVTGEALPVAKGPGDCVVSGTILQAGSIQFRASSGKEHSAIAELSRMVQGELGEKDKTILKADRIAQAFTPLILAIGFAALPLLYLSGLSWIDIFVRILALFLIACPCAIGIAAPVVEARLVRCFSGLGAVVRNRALFSQLAKATLFLFDKTGTLTIGKPVVKLGINDLNAEQKSILKAICAQSIHPLAKAITAAIEIDPVDIDRVTEYPGKGIEAIHEDCLYSVGSLRWMSERGIELPFTQGDATLVYFCKDKVCLCAIELEDTLRRGADELPKPSVILSGDRTAAVRAIASKLAMETFQSEMSGQEKCAYVKEAKKRGETVVFVGDGINDTPALVAADVGISVLSSTDLAYHVSDLYLLSGNLGQLTLLQKISRKGEKLIAQNFFWAFFYNGIGIPLALTGWLSPLFATIAMALSSTIVLLNARRLRITSPE